MFKTCFFVIMATVMINLAHSKVIIMKPSDLRELLIASFMKGGKQALELVEEKNRVLVETPIDSTHMADAGAPPKKAAATTPKKDAGFIGNLEKKATSWWNGLWKRMRL